MPKESRKNTRGPSRPLQVTYAEIAQLSGISERTAREYARTQYDAADLVSVVQFIDRRREALGLPLLTEMEIPEHDSTT